MQNKVDKHKIWLIAGISLVIVLVLFLVLYSPVNEALFGKSIADGTTNSCTDSTTCSGTRKCVSNSCVSMNEMVEYFRSYYSSPSSITEAQLNIAIKYWKKGC